MYLLNICFSSVVSVAAMFISVKIIGNRQMSELNMFDYINGITIGSIAAEMATSLEGDFIKPLVAMAVYTLIVFLTSVVTTHSLKIRRFISGRTLMLVSNGSFLPQNFKKCRLDLSEFLNQCRVQGFFNPDDIAYAFMEENGKISILPKSEAQPITAAELSAIERGEGLGAALPFFTIISDGHILTGNLSAAGFDSVWLKKRLSERGIKNEREVFLACVNAEGSFCLFPRKQKRFSENDIFG